MVRKKHRKLKSWVKTTLVCITIFVLVTGLRATGVFNSNYVVGHSMDPTLHPNEIVFRSNIPEIGRYDVVIAQAPTGNEVIKRVIGLPGDSVSFYGAHIYINGRLSDESFLATDARNSRLPTETPGTTITLQENEYFVAGDNRNNSTDSRVYGALSKDMIQGKVVFTCG